ncbi:MAG: helical backbone metal receptor, partial [Bacteroidota bacterium]
QSRRKKIRKNLMSFIDQIGHSISLKEFPSRIISLVPSQTEYLHYLGLEKEVLGITKFCIHPHDWFKTKTRIGGTKTVDIEKIRSLNPDLILANKEENTQEIIQSLQAEFNTWTSDVIEIKDALEMLLSVGKMTGKENKAVHLVQELKKDLALIQSTVQHPSFIYLIWKDPIMAVGSNTFINSVLTMAGFQNALEHTTRYPSLTIEEIQKIAPNFLFCSSEPFPFKEEHINAFQAQLPNTKVVSIDGEICSWYGNRMLKIKDYFLNMKRQLSII